MRKVGESPRRVNDNFGRVREKQLTDSSGRLLDTARVSDLKRTLDSLGRLAESLGRPDPNVDYTRSTLDQMLEQMNKPLVEHAKPSSPIPQEFYNALQANLQISNRSTEMHPSTFSTPSSSETRADITQARSQEIPHPTSSQDFLSIKQMNQQFSQELHHLKSETQQLFNQTNLNSQTLLQQSSQLLKENYQILQQQHAHNVGLFTQQTALDAKPMATSQSAQNFNETTKTLSSDSGSYMDVTKSQSELSTSKPFPDTSVTGKELEAISETESVPQAIRVNEPISHQQYSSSTDEGIETDVEDSPGSGRSSGTNNHPRGQQKCLSQHLSSDSSNFESSFDYQIDQELATSLPSCTSPSAGRPVNDSLVISTSPFHTNLSVSASKPFRHNPLIGNFRNRSPVDFREGRRASDGLVAQQVIADHTQSHNFIAFNSQRLNETGKTMGVMELHLVQREHEALKNLYQQPTQEEQTVRQIQHVQYHQSPPSPPNGQQTVMAQKAPLQQQLMQHRLQQQKRHILQKQGALPPQELGYLSQRQRQMVRQPSYKMAQQAPVLVPLPHNELSGEVVNDLIPIAEDCTNGHNEAKEVEEQVAELPEPPTTPRKLPIPIIPMPSERCERQLPVPPVPPTMERSEGRQLPTPPCDRQQRPPGTGRLLPTIGIQHQRSFEIQPRLPDQNKLNQSLDYSYKADEKWQNLPSTMANCQIGNARSFFVQNRGKDSTEALPEDGAWANNPWGCPPEETWYQTADNRPGAPDVWCQQVLATNSV